MAPSEDGQSAEAPLPSLKEEVYLDERKLLVDLEQKSADQHDKAILTLAAGGLVLSITFLEKIAPNPLPGTLWLIGCSWGCFIASLFAILASFLTSQRACCRQRDILDQKVLDTSGPECEEMNNWVPWTHMLNFTSYGCFAAAVLFLACFSWQNIQVGRTKNMADQEKSKVENKEESQKRGTEVVLPKPPATPTSPANDNRTKPFNKTQ